MKKANVWVLGLDERGTPDYTDFDFRSRLRPRPRPRRRRPARPRQKNLRPPPPHPHGRPGLLPQRLRRRRRRHVRSPPPAPPTRIHTRRPQTRQSPAKASAPSNHRPLNWKSRVLQCEGTPRLQRWVSLGSPTIRASARGVCSLLLSAQRLRQRSPLQIAVACVILFTPSSLHAQQTEPPSGTPIATQPTAQTAPTDILPAAPITDAERSSILFTSTVLDLHLIPADARASPRHPNPPQHLRRPAHRIPLQISCTLRWESFSALPRRAFVPFPSPNPPSPPTPTTPATPQEAILTPAQTLAPGATLTLSAFYSGQIKQSAARLELPGAHPGT